MDSFTQLTDDCDVSLFSDLGHGAVSVVHLGRQDIAIKRMYYKDENDETDEEIKELAMQEIRNFKAMKYHPNIVQYYNYRDDGSSIWIMMEHCNLGSLDNYLAHNDIDLNQKVDFMRQITEGLNYMHALGIPHGDLKPANILIKKDGDEYLIKLSDFSGIGITGTQPYMAPELFAVTKSSQPMANINRFKTDIFSLGLLFVDILDDGKSNGAHIHAKGEVFGEMLYEASLKQVALPKLFNEQDGIDDITRQLHDMIRTMTLIDADDRISLSDLSYQLNAIELLMTGDEGSSDINAKKQALMTNNSYLVDFVNSEVLLVHCFSKHIISITELDLLKKASDKYGPSHQNEILLDIIVRKKPTEILNFWNILKHTHPNVHAYLQRTIDQTKQGCAPIEGEEVERKVLRETFRQWHDVLCEQLNTREIILHLFQINILSMREFGMLHRAIRFGLFNANDRLIEIMLKKGSHEMKLFFEKIKASNPSLYAKVNSTMQRKSSMWITDLEETRRQLIRIYTMKEYHIIQALPGENCQLNLQDKSSLIPLEFTAQKKNPVSKYNYTLEFNSIEEIVGALSKHEDSLMTLTAPPGYGKTVFTHLLIHQWIEKSNPMLDIFQAIFLIHIRDINVKSSILEILGDSRSVSDYEKDEIKATLHSLLSRKDAAVHMLMILDGIDQVAVPKGCDLYKILTGDLYPHVRKMVTSRPEASVLNDISPSYKVKLTGISTDESHKYLKMKVQQSDQSWDESVLVLLKQLQGTSEVSDLLKIPLYLTMIGFVFDKYKNKSFKHFSWPNTVTHLFNVFLTFLLRSWLIRLGRMNEAKILDFDRYVLDRESNVPMDIKMKLYSFGSMSFYNLTKQVYVFTEVDLCKMFIDINDVEESGLFDITHHDKGFQLTFSHKQFQEFMAAIYLAHGLELDRLLADIRKQEEAPQAPLSCLFQDMYSVLPFIFGLSPTVALDILNATNNRVCVASDCDGINIGFESRLCFESCNKEVQDRIIQIILSSKKSNTDHHDFVAPVSNVYSLCKELTNEQAQIILQNWYGLTILHCTSNSFYIKNNESDEEKYLFLKEDNVLQIKLLNDFLFFLLLKFSFPQVTMLGIERSNVTDIRRITQPFPNLVMLDLDDGNPRMDEFINSCCGTPLPKIQSSLEVVTFRCYDVPLPRCSLMYLLEEAHLSELKLKWVNLLTTDITSLLHGPVWPNLTDLEICLWQLQDEILETVYSNLAILAQCVLQLQSLSLGCNFNKTTPQKRDFLQQKILSLPHKFQKLKTLRLHRILFPFDIEALCLCLGDLSSLSTLGLWWRDFEGKEKTLVDTLQYSSNVSKLQVMFGSQDKKQADSAVKTLSTFSECYMKIESWKWELAVGSFDEELKLV